MNMSIFLNETLYAEFINNYDSAVCKDKGLLNFNRLNFIVVLTYEKY